MDTRAFIRALDNTLPKWAPLFQKYSGEFDWRLVAALAYQESHWKPHAKSPTGVRGMMMLTLPTAKSVGVSDRLDPEQSIRGGAEYLRRMVARIPDSVTEHEKIWFALASYNVGYGHMMDARRLTRAQGGNLMRGRMSKSACRYCVRRNTIAKHAMATHAVMKHRSMLRISDVITRALSDMLSNTRNWKATKAKSLL
ncbi:transglycosylase Slt family [Vibrio astriarenae]|nr:transglycosylase Slt family [Vibrio sp. C7]